MGELNRKLRLATMWLGGCSGCHMSFMDLDEFLIDLAARVDVVFSPVVDVKRFPQDVDVVLIEGAIANVDHLHMVQAARANTRVLVSFGDCAVTGNVTALRNSLGLDNVQQVIERAYPVVETRPPIGVNPALVPQVLPVHAVVPVEVYLPGCPPPAPRIRAVLERMLAGLPPVLEGRDMLKFG